jgi:NTE family protein
MIAIALGGGGSKAAFQVGAVKYLYQELGIRPNVITATSGGALNGAKLAEGGDDVPARLEAIWRSLDTNSDMWVTAPWLQNLSANVQKILEEIAKNAVECLVSISAGSPMMFLDVIKDIEHTADDIKNLVASITGARSIYDLAPIEAKLRNPAIFDEAKVLGSTIDLRLATVGLESGELRYILKNGTIEGRSDLPIRLADAVLT